MGYSGICRVRRGGSQWRLVVAHRCRNVDNCGGGARAGVVGVSFAQGIRVGRRRIGVEWEAYIVAEMSANHGQDLEVALAIVQAAADAGADAVKTQLYTPETLGATQAILEDGPWAGETMHDLYLRSAMPWEWCGPISRKCKQLKLDWLTSVYDRSSIEYALEYDPVALKIASFELTDLDLVAAVVETQIPTIMSTGMADGAEIIQSVDLFPPEEPPILLHCVSAYPCPAAYADLTRLDEMGAYSPYFGYSDHTVGVGVATAAAVLGAMVIEKHLCISREGPDGEFSATPDQFRDMVVSIRDAEAAIHLPPTGDIERASRRLRRATGGARGTYWKDAGGG